MILNLRSTINIPVLTLPINSVQYVVSRPPTGSLASLRLRVINIAIVTESDFAPVLEFL